MIFKRKIYDKFLLWKNESKGSSALLIEGARRIGKSTIVEEFAKKEYLSYLMVDFTKITPVVINAFETCKNNIDDFFLLLSTEYGVSLKRRQSVVIFDEVQQYPKAREFIKYLVADGRYDFIETGSLISIKQNVKNIVIPSEEEKIKMYPLDFEEFCWAIGEETMPDYIRQCFLNKKPLEDNLHKKAMFIFKQYLLVGGMPQSVNAFINNDKSFEAADKVKRKILDLYRNDIMKIDAPYKSKVLSIFEQIPGFLSQHEKRVILNQISDGSSIDQYSETVCWLGNSMICNECFSCNDPNVGLSLNENRTKIKCYMGDTGLLVSHSFDENEIADEQLYKQILNDKLSINKGMFFENIVAQMLSANGHKLFFYTRFNSEKHRNDIEIDFLISNKSKLKQKIFPIEVKSGKNYSTTSINSFAENYKDRIGASYIIHPKNFKLEDNKIYLPVYMTFCL